MSIASEITRIKNNIEDAYTECENKGATLPETENSANLADTIASIPSGGGDLSEYFQTDYTRFNFNRISYNLLLKIPKINMASDIISLYSCFAYWCFKELNLPEMDIPNVTDLSYCFFHAGDNNTDGISGTIDLSKFKNANKVTNFNSMFSYARMNNIINFSALNTNTVINTSNMFNGFKIGSAQSPIANLDLSSLNQIKPTDMSRMFMSSNFNSIDLRNIDTSNTTDMSSMFSACSASQLYLEDFNTSNTQNFSSMFQSMSSMKHLDISNFKIDSATNINFMFGYSNYITTLDISGMDFTNPPAQFFGVFNCGKNCKQSDGAYADGIPYIYVKDATAQNWVLTANNGHPTTWTTDNVVIKSN